ncbi:15-cis-phytoene synthase CrtB [Pantoea sp. Nvir]|uniref:15-cis-phytoene synthase CrtB n=1 Tax=Pantoea sp. Nvir TaxID=2576760 RepID=UPI0027EBC27B|nr:15-cis-phytoene synthase CrtB [Pantoea sp. Nvir]CAJ0992747.1 15-cis-phytoene synthase [Pantoea sp. Nvir]
MNNTKLLHYAVKVIEVGSKSFSIASKLFNAKTRRSVLMLYAWCRYCDDVVDNQRLGFPSVSSLLHTPQQRLTELELKTRQAYSGMKMHELAFEAFQEVVFTHSISSVYAFEHLEGFAMDVRDTRYETLQDTLRYCYHVAGVVGLMMAQIMGVRDDLILDRACDLGIAFQLTNIARDIIEDSRIGRCYLPESWLREAGLDRLHFADHAYRSALSCVARRLLSQAELYYASASVGLAGISFRSTWAIATAKEIYRRIGVKVYRKGESAWDYRQSTSIKEKFLLLVMGAAQAIRSRVSASQPRSAALWQRSY